MLKGKAPQDQN